MRWLAFLKTKGATIDMEVKTKDLWVFIETTKDGNARNVGLELLEPGRLLADAQGGKLVGVVIGGGVKSAVKSAIQTIRIIHIISQNIMRKYCIN